MGFNLSDHGSLGSGSGRHSSDFKDEPSIGRLSEQHRDDSSVANSGVEQVNYEPGSEDGSIRGLDFNLSDHGNLGSGSGMHSSHFRDEASVGCMGETSSMSSSSSDEVTGAG